MSDPHTKVSAVLDRLEDSRTEGEPFTRTTATDRVLAMVPTTDTRDHSSDPTPPDETTALATAIHILACELHVPILIPA